MAAVTHGIATASSSNVTSYASGSFTPAVGDLLVAFVIASGTVQDPSTLTDSQGGTYTQKLRAVKNTSADSLYLFVGNQLVPSATSTTVTFDCTGDSATGAIIFVARIAGITIWGNGGSSIRQTAKQDNQAGTNAPAPAFGSSALTGNPTLGCVANGANPAALTPPTSWTEDAAGDTGYTTPATGGEYVYRNSGFTGTTVTWGSTTATYCSMIVEIDASVPADQPVTSIQKASY